MRYIILIYVLLFQTSKLLSQEWCDPTLAICDSVFIDSIIFAELPTTGEHVIFQVTTEHYFLYAPSFVICSDNNIDFSNTSHGYFSIYGPQEIMPLYGYDNIDVTDSIFEGYMVVENSANEIENCIIHFSTNMPDVNTSINSITHENKVRILPNPVEDYLSVEIDNDVSVRKISIIDMQGRQQEIEITSNIIDVSSIPKGWYIVQLEFDSGDLFTQKVMIKL